MNRKLKHIVISSIVLFGPLTIVMEAKATGRLNPSAISKVVAGVKKAATGSINTSQFNQQKILDNLSIPERLQEKAKSLIENGIIKHSNTENIKQQRREQVQTNK